MKIPTLDELDLPPILNEIVMSRRGLVIIVGTMGSGKSTSLAVMVGYCNANSYGHIIAIENLVECVHAYQNCVVVQCEVDVDIESWHVALKDILCQAPDVILIGKIRDHDTMEHAIQYAKTDHLCLAALYANSSNQAIGRIISFFPEEKCQQLLIGLSLSLYATVTQRLLLRQDKKGRVPAIEVTLATPLVQDFIFKGEAHRLKEIMKKSHEQGIILFDRALFDLYEENEITYGDVLRNTDSLNDLHL